MGQSRKESRDIVRRIEKRSRRLFIGKIQWRALFYGMKNRIIYHFTNIRSRYIIALSKE